MLHLLAVRMYLTFFGHSSTDTLVPMTCSSLVACIKQARFAVFCMSDQADNHPQGGACNDRPTPEHVEHNRFENEVGSEEVSSVNEDGSENGWSLA